MIQIPKKKNYPLEGHIKLNGITFLHEETTFGTISKMAGSPIPLFSYFFSIYIYMYVCLVVIQEKKIFAFAEDVDIHWPYER